jgi:hypothetical protein
MLGLTCTQSNLERYLWRLRSSANHGNVRVSSFELRSASDRQFRSLGLRKARRIAVFSEAIASQKLHREGTLKCFLVPT